MARTTIKAFVHEVGTIESIGEKQTKKQMTLLREPGYKDPFSDVEPKDKYWYVAIIGKDFDKNVMDEKSVGKKGVFTLYVDPAWTEKKEATATTPAKDAMCFYNVNFGGVEWK